MNTNTILIVASVLAFTGVCVNVPYKADQCANFSGYAGCSLMDPQYVIAKNTIENAQQGPLSDLKTLVSLCRNTKRPSRKDFLQPYIDQYNTVIRPYLKRQEFPEAFAVTAAFLNLNFNYDFFIQHATDFRKRSVWREVLIAQRNYSAVFEDAEEVKRTVKGLQMSDALINQILKFEKRLVEEREKKWDLTSFADNHYFNAYLEYVAKYKIIDSSLLNDTFVYYAPGEHPAAFDNTSPEVIQAYLKAVVYKIIDQKYDELAGFDCNDAIQKSWTKTVSKLLEDELLPSGTERETLDQRIEDVFYDIKMTVVELLHQLDLKDPELNQKLVSVIPDFCIQFHAPNALDKLSDVVRTLNSHKPESKWGFVKALTAYKINDALTGAEQKLACYPLRLSANILTHFKWTEELDDPTFYATVGYEIARLLWNSIGKAAKREDFDAFAESQAKCLTQKYFVDKFLSTARSYDYLALQTAFSAFQHRQAYGHKPTVFSTEARNFFLAFQKERRCSDRGTPIHLREFYGFINQYECSLKPQCNIWPVADFEVFVKPEQWSMKLNPPVIDQSEEAQKLADYIEERLDLTYRPCLDFFKYTCGGMPLSQFNNYLRDEQHEALDYLKHLDEDDKTELVRKLSEYTNLTFDGFMEHLFAMNVDENIKKNNLKKLETLKLAYNWENVIDYVVSHQIDNSTDENIVQFPDGNTPTQSQIQALLIAVSVEMERAPASVWLGRFGIKIGKEIGKAFDIFGSQIEDLSKTYKIEDLANFDDSDPKYESLVASIKCLNKSFNLGLKTMSCHNRITDDCVEDLVRVNEVVSDIQAIQSAYRAHRNYVIRYGPCKRPPGTLVSRMTTEQLLFISVGQFICAQNQPEYGIFASKSEIPTEKRVKAALSNFPLFAMAFNCPTETEYRPDISVECNVFARPVLAKNRYPFDTLDF
ncbi:unnamed protein product [Bursaphelenchus xylophilus]|uniref:(pine wood nematode) hypothetical protein n=1 Tax=Bursaphelenchus xylophilus TaxID=6326 RepID=A0A811L3P2_BURXY|nr:unnamed protein product [Bursaphelenchus xylophilus]CAG9109311.1 unnamed protein product [Bursaphelenchus xylophilus]